MVKSALLIIILFVLSYSAVGQTTRIVASFGDTLPPYVFKDGPSGILIDLLKDCLAPSGYTVSPRLHPYARRIVEYETNQVDVVTDINEKVLKDSKLKGFYTGHIYAYENFLFSLAERELRVEKIEDLSAYSLLSWQGAIAHIGGEYATMALRNKQYRETHNQKTQLRMLFNKRVDFIQMDGNIYKFFRQELADSQTLDVSAPVDIFPLLGKSPNGFLFKSEAPRDACVANLNLIKENEKYKDILYFDRYDE